jgi:transaldolase
LLQVKAAVMRTIETTQMHAQSIWLDHAYQEPLTDGNVSYLIAGGAIQGLTSSTGLAPGRFSQCLLEESDLRLLSHAGNAGGEILLELLVTKFRTAADLFMPIFEQTNAQGGFVTLDIDPRVHTDPASMTEAAINLWGRINRPNLIVSIPATSDTMMVLGDLLEKGVNVDASMICSIEHYLDVLECYLGALDRRLQTGAGIEHVVSTATFNIPVIDQLINRRLSQFEGKGVESQRARALIDQVGMAVAKLAYAQFKVSFNDERFDNLQAQGGRAQRLVWTGFGSLQSSTSRQYFVQLAAPGTIAAMRADSFDVEIDGGAVGSLGEGLSEARGKLQALESIGIIIDEVVTEFEAKFFAQRKQGYENVLASVDTLVSEYEQELGEIVLSYRSLLGELKGREVISRIWQSDASLWSDDRRFAKRISDKMGWLDLPSHLDSIAGECRQYVADLRDETIHRLIFLASGSIGELLRSVAGQADNIDRTLRVVDLSPNEDLDSMIGDLKLQQAHFILLEAHNDAGAAIKEMEGLLYRLAESGEFNPEEQLTVIAHTEMVDSVHKSGLGYRAAFMIPDEIPLHFAVLSYPGMIACDWMGLDLNELQAGLAGVMNQCLPAVPADRNPGLGLAIAIAAAVQSSDGPIVLAGDEAHMPNLDWVRAILHDANLLGEGGPEVAVVSSPGDLPQHDNPALTIYLRDRSASADRLGRYAAVSEALKCLELEVGAVGLGRMVGVFLFATVVVGAIWNRDPFGHSRR